MFNLNTNTETNNPNYFKPSSEYQPVLKKMRFDPDYQNTHNNGNLLHILGDNQNRPAKEYNLTEKKLSKLSLHSLSEEEENASEWQDVFDAAKRSGNAEELLMMIQDGLLSTIDQEDLKEIFEFGLINKNKEIILACTEKGLGPKDRHTAYKFAIFSNDPILVEAALQGAKGQKIFDWPKFYHPYLTVNDFSNKCQDERIINVLCNLYGLTDSNLKEYAWRKFLGNLWGIEGKFRLDGQKDEYMGTYMHHFTMPILSALHSFRIENPNVIDEELLTLQFDAVKEASNPNQKYNINLKKPILIHAGLLEHQIEIVVWEKYLLICNKGLLSQEPIKVYTFDPNRLTTEVFDKIETCRIKFNDEKAEKFYSSTLPTLLNAVPHDILTDLFTIEWIDEDLEQEKDNCVWESLRTALFGMAGMHAWINNDCETNENNKFKQQTLAKALQKFIPWDSYVGLYSLGKYIDYTAKDPTELDRKLAISILKSAKELMHNGEVDPYHYEEILGKFIKARSQSIEMENRRLKTYQGDI